MVVSGVTQAIPEQITTSMAHIVHEVHSAGAFLAQTAALRQADPIATNHMASIATAVLSGARPAAGIRFFVVAATAPDNDDTLPTSLALWNVPRRSIYLSPTVSTADAIALGHHLGSSSPAHGIECSGARDAVEAFGRTFCNHQEVETTLQWKEDLVLYVLATLRIPTTVAGRMRVATCGDLTFLTEWTQLYNVSIRAPLADAHAFVVRTFSTQSLFVWENDAGSPVAYGSLAPTVQLDGGVMVFRIGSIFVPENERRKGYASAITAALSAFVLAKDETMTAKVVCLYASAGNPASNKAYQNVGFVKHSETSTFACVHAAPMDQGS
ncbi:Aste57867_22907 [Aphanomyces stellatus]|uniref:Aste57867_22907 protein n=1 Tax=Aphanomyces stellatus TaxID=120398 RepID=A0A485LLF3_9STRA|nr:hypothetical protein As57867_022836 [Aphanomyces stellatus]VFT99557.1 Aste57867_22907 [Aphanomyces stellatus]